MAVTQFYIADRPKVSAGGDGANIVPNEAWRRIGPAASAPELRGCTKSSLRCFHGMGVGGWSSLAPQLSQVSHLGEATSLQG